MKVSLAFLRGSDNGIYTRGDAVVTAMPGNPAFTKPPSDLEVLKTLLASYNTSITASLDGGKAATANRQTQRDLVVKELRLLAHYVEAVANGNAATIISSGFEPLTLTRNTAPQPIAIPTIRSIDHGPSAGQLVVYIPPVSGAASYELRYALQPSGPWITQPVTRVRPPALVEGLVPGGAYQFQVRALGHQGYTDYSNVYAKFST